MTKDKGLEKILEAGWKVQLTGRKYLTLRKGSVEMLYDRKRRMIIEVYKYGGCTE
ncbi:hypothetical protein LCGC14_2055500 [marine sediment metagenome]|uniref:Uncharacterized protein n=1 Tax=marine sediment metagenome TaxID=412755 RepID=A0A0F9HJR6_9ZZZZ